jgi:hypothetical protein
MISKIKPYKIFIKSSNSYISVFGNINKNPTFFGPILIGNKIPYFEYFILEEEENGYSDDNYFIFDFEYILKKLNNYQKLWNIIIDKFERSINLTRERIFQLYGDKLINRVFKYYSWCIKGEIMPENMLVLEKNEEKLLYYLCNFSRDNKKYIDDFVIFKNEEDFLKSYKKNIK